MINVDFGATGQDVLSGFEEFSGTDIRSVSKTYSGITVTVSNNSGSVTLDFRNRLSMTHALGNLLEDNVWPGSDTTALLVALRSLPAATYSITTYHHDSWLPVQNNGTFGSIEVNTGSGFSIAVAGPLTRTIGTNPVTVASYTFPFTASGADVVIRLNAGIKPANLNGFKLEIVPRGTMIRIF